jgi:hypothetical protein
MQRDALEVEAEGAEEGSRWMSNTNSNGEGGGIEGFRFNTANGYGATD